MSLRHLGLVSFLVACTLGGAACVFVPPPNNGGDNNDGGDPNAAGTITIRVVNTTDITLDPEIFLSATAVSREELFNLNRKYTAFGVGTLGLIARFSSDSFTVPCSDARLIGTLGGRFGDNLNNPDGVGREIILAQDLSVFCGGRVTFTYSRQPGGGFTTAFVVEP
ncbi:MAG TPA: hypothetical protein PKC49_00290 [Phycisphaerae bacterium]|nr:hypothetical protein [Phycisphaerae bacterium]